MPWPHIFLYQREPRVTVGVPLDTKKIAGGKREGPMPDVSEKIVENLRYLRRYARALLGSQQTGDTYVRICLEDLLEEPVQARGARIVACGDGLPGTGSLGHFGSLRLTSAGSRAPRRSRPQLR